MSVKYLFQVDRLMELHFKYLDAMQVADKKIEGEKHVGTPAYLLLALTYGPFGSLVHLTSPHRTGFMCHLVCCKSRADGSLPVVITDLLTGVKVL